jgi:hypothetical protein
MKLLVFAHRGEAQSFIKHFKMTPCEFILNGLFKNEDTYLLLTGEGFKDASEKVVTFLAQYHHLIKSVFNIGVAGSLSPKYKVFDTLWIRTSLAHNSEKCEFKTYTSKFHSKVDCLTVYSRITTENDKKFYSQFADVIDRELWPIMSAAHLFKCDAYSLKIISDDLKNENDCAIIKEDASLFSQKLLEEFLTFSQLDLKQKDSPLKNLSDDASEFILHHPSFHITVSQKRKMQTLVHGLIVKGKFTHESLIDYVTVFALKALELDDEINPKDLTKKLLIQLNEELNPLNVLIKKSLEEALSPLTDSGISCHYDPELEIETITINHKINSTRDVKKLILALEHFKFDKIKNIFNGILDDDL